MRWRHAATSGSQGQGTIADADVTNPNAASIANALAGDPPRQRLLLFVDQFEELFSQVKEAATRDKFLDRLKTLRADPRCTVLLTTRADFYGDLMNSALWPIDRSQIVEIVPLRGDQGLAPGDRQAGQGGGRLPG